MGQSYIIEDTYIHALCPLCFVVSSDPCVYILYRFKRVSASASIYFAFDLLVNLLWRVTWLIRRFGKIQWTLWRTFNYTFNLLSLGSLRWVNRYGTAYHGRRCVICHSAFKDPWQWHDVLLSSAKPAQARLLPGSPCFIIDDCGYPPSVREACSG